MTLFLVTFFYALSFNPALARDQAFDACQRNVIMQRDTLCIRTREIGNSYFQPVSYGRRAESWRMLCINFGRSALEDFPAATRRFDKRKET